LARWIAHYGETVARDIAIASAARPSLDITVKSDPRNGRRAARRDAADRFRAPPLQGSVTMLPGFAKAMVGQDAAAALPARLFADVAGKTIADLCAAPVARQHNSARRPRYRGRSFDHRVTRLRENLARLGLEAETVTATPRVARRSKWRRLRTASWSTAPCASAGTIRRHPDVAWLRQEAISAR